MPSYMWLLDCIMSNLLVIADSTAEHFWSVHYNLYIGQWHVNVIKTILLVSVIWDRLHTIYNRKYAKTIQTNHKNKIVELNKEKRKKNISHMKEKI